MRGWLGKINGIVILISRKFLALLCKLDRKLQLPFNADRHYCGVIMSTVSHDMASDVDEKYYTEQYWQIIKKHLNRLVISDEVSCLDLGCGQGRFVVPLADWCSRYDGRVIGVDVSVAAIEEAKKNVELSGQQNIQFKAENIHEYITTVADASVDVVFFLEVIFFLPNYEAVLTHIVRVLKPGGFLMASFRSQYFDVLFSLKHGMWDSLNVLLNQRGGRLWGKDIFFNWHTADEIAEILENKYALQLLELRGIGCCSGIAGDPFGDIVSPSKLSKSEFDRLMDVELEMGRHVPDAGRYILTIAQKK